MNDLPMHAISPVDGRYCSKTEPLSAYFSDFALTKTRVETECRYVIALDRFGLFKKLSSDELASLANLTAGFCESDYYEIKRIEASVIHDVKACELFIRVRAGLSCPNMIHFGLTSEDVNNISYALMVMRYRDGIQLETMKSLIEKLCDMAIKWRSVPFPAKTHGQPASPSTAGKELSVFASRLANVYGGVKKCDIMAKLNGAVGNYSAMRSAFPDFDWISFSDGFIKSLGFLPETATTQVGNRDWLIDYLDRVRHFNNVLLDMDVDMWQYVSFGFFKGSAPAGSVGSSTMPHKINPINFENGEGNVAVANALLSMVSDRIGRSRMQRDLSDSTVMRNIGVALAHSHMAVMESASGLSKTSVDVEKCAFEISRRPELIAEAVQTILRTCTDDDPYMIMKEMTMGKSVSIAEIMKFVDGLPIPDDKKLTIKNISPVEYIGLAETVCDRAVASARNIIGCK